MTAALVRGCSGNRPACWAPRVRLLWLNALILVVLVVIALVVIALGPVPRAAAEPGRPAQTQTPQQQQPTAQPQEPTARPQQLTVQPAESDDPATDESDGPGPAQSEPESEEPSAPTSEPSPTSGTSGEPTPESTQADSVSPEDVPVLEPRAPAEATSRVSLSSALTAIAVLLAALVVLLVLRSKTRPEEPGGRVAERRSGMSPATQTFAAIEAVGEAMLDAGYPVMAVQSALQDIAEVNGYPSIEVVAFPTALFVSTNENEQLRTGAVASGTSRLLLHQVDALDRLVGKARLGAVDPREIGSRIAAIRADPMPYSPWARVLAHAVVSAALSVLLGASWVGVGFTGALGAIVGGVLLVASRSPRSYEPLVTAILAFVVAAAVFTLSRAGWDPGVLPCLVAPVVILLPGALLTTGVIELASGQMMSGAGRLAAGFMQLVLLGVGFVAGAMLVGVPRMELTEAHAPLGPLGPWLAVAVFGVGIVINQGGRLTSIPWILLVLYVAFGAQVLGSIYFGGVLSALIGAFAMTPVAVIVSRLPSGPAAMVSFFPAFWLLVPGALGLVGVTTILAGESGGATTVVTTIATMVAIALGVLAGSAFSLRFRVPSTLAPTP